MRGLPIAFVVLLASRLASAGGSTLVSSSTTRPGTVDTDAGGPALPTAGELAPLASAIVPAARALAQPLARSSADLAALAAATGDALATVEGNRMPSLACLTVEPIAQVQSSGFGWRVDPFRHTRRDYHPGTDFRAHSGTPVLAAGDGVAVYAGRMHGYGNVVFIAHGDGLVTRYAHLRRIEIRRGAQVTAGQQIGLVGMTGHATGPHLHFEVRLDGRPVDPVWAMAVAELERDAPLAGRVARFALIPAIQREVGEPGLAYREPAHAHAHAHAHSHAHHHHHTRPERRGHTKRPQPIS